MEILAAVLAILSAILPPLVGHFTVKAKERKQDNEALTRRSLDELDAGVNQLRNDKPPLS